MFTKKFNNLPESLVEITEKILKEPIVEESKKIDEASNEQPNINHLELSEEELNELSPAALQAYREKSRERMRNPNVVGHELQKRQTGFSTAGKKLSGDAKVRAKEPANKPTTTTAQKPSFGVKAGKITPKTPYNPSYSMIKEPPKERNYGGSSMPHKAAASPMKEEVDEEVMPKGMSMKERTAFHMAAAAASKAGKSHFEFGGKEYPATMSKDVASKMNEDSIDEALSPEAKRRRDELKAKVRAAKDAYKDIQKQAKSPKSGLAPLKSVTPKAEPEDPEESARKHPIDRLRRIALSTGGGHFEYDNGEKHKISRDVARTVVKHYELPSEQGGLKPYQKEKLQSDITKSHEHMMNHYNKISGTNEDAYAPDSTPAHPAKGKPMLLEPGKAKKNKKELDEVPIETVKQIRMFHQNEETDDETPPFEPDKKKVNWKSDKQSRATWLAKHARDAMKKNMKTEEEEDVKPGAPYAKKVQVPEGYIRIGKPGASLSDVASGRPGSIRKTLGDPSHSKPQKMDAKEPTERKPLENRIGEEVNERKMTDAETKKREDIVMTLKKKMAGFKKRYGSRAKDVMYATATKMAMKEEEKTPKDKTMTGQKADPIEVNPSAPTKEGIGVKSTTT